MPVSLSLSPLLIALAAMLWGSDLLLRPQALSSGWSPAQVVLGEHLLLTAAFSLVLWRGRRILRGLTRAQWGALLFISWGGSALATWLYTEAFTLGPPLTAVLLQKTQPLFALIGAWALLGERRRAGFWGWCVIALLGALLLTGITQPARALPTRADQALCALGAAALWGGATVAGRFLSSALTPALLAASRFALAVPLLAVSALLPHHGGDAALHAASDAGWFLLLIVLFPDLLGMGLYYWGLRGTSASVATLAELCYPLTSLALGILVQHTTLTLSQGAGILLLVGAVLGVSFAPGVAAQPQGAVAIPGDGGYDSG